MGNGNHSATVVIDVGNDITETDETNNSWEITFRVPPDDPVEGETEGLIEGEGETEGIAEGEGTAEGEGDGEGDGEGIGGYTVSLAVSPTDAGTINFIPDSSETEMTVETGTRVSIGGTPYPGWHLNNFKVTDSAGHAVYYTTDSFLIIVRDDLVVTAQFVLNYVSVPTIAFRCGVDDSIRLSVRVPVGSDLHDYLIDPTIGDLTYVGVAGPNGNWVWDPATSPYHPDIIMIGPSKETFWLIPLTTNFESWNPDHFRGNLFAVDNTGQMSFFDLSLWSVNYGLDDSVVIDDGEGLIIDFLRVSGGCQ